MSAAADTLLASVVLQAEPFAPLAYAPVPPTELVQLILATTVRKFPLHDMRLEKALRFAIELTWTTQRDLQQEVRP